MQSNIFNRIARHVTSIYCLIKCDASVSPTTPRVVHSSSKISQFLTFSTKPQRPEPEPEGCTGSRSRSDKGERASTVSTPSEQVFGPISTCGDLTLHQCIHIPKGLEAKCVDITNSIRINVTFQSGIVDIHDDGPVGLLCLFLIVLLSDFMLPHYVEKRPLVCSMIL